jgi:hypothetical protein
VHDAEPALPVGGLVEHLAERALAFRACRPRALIGRRLVGSPAPPTRRRKAASDLPGAFAGTSDWTGWAHETLLGPRASPLKGR